MSASARWPELWNPVEKAETRNALEGELVREISDKHALHGVPVTALGRHDNQDDVLFALRDGRVAEVHLTMQGRAESNPQWPQTTFYPSFEIWAGEKQS